MRRARLSRLAARLRVRLARNPALTVPPLRCNACGLLCRAADMAPDGWHCRGCVQDQAEMVWDDTDDNFLPPED